MLVFIQLTINLLDFESSVGLLLLLLLLLSTMTVCVFNPTFYLKRGKRSLANQIQSFQKWRKSFLYFANRSCNYSSWCCCWYLILEMISICFWKKEVLFKKFFAFYKATLTRSKLVPLLHISTWALKWRQK